MVRSRHIAASLIIFSAFLAAVSLFRSLDHRSIFARGTMSVTHTVLFQFKADANPEEVRAVRHHPYLRNAVVPVPDFDREAYSHSGVRPFPCVEGQL